MATVGMSAVGTLLPTINPSFASTPNLREFSLRAAPGKTTIAPEPYAETEIWGYNGVTPGPELRVKQGDRLRITVENALTEETTVHWHGLRIPNAVDGVPHLTQRPIKPGEEFVYEFDAVDAGTFWYHPHQRSFEQVGRGLSGPLIIEEHDPIHVDRDITWVLDDWRLTKKAAISNDFGNRHDMAHSGRIGNTVTINGQIPDTFAVRRGERIRLRLINAANARIFALDFKEHDPIIIALDGQPVTPHAPNSGMVVLGPAMRADIILDMTAGADSTYSIIDRYYAGLEYELTTIAYAVEPLRDKAPNWPMALPANQIPEPDLSTNNRHEIIFNGGMMGGMMMGDQASNMMEMMHDGHLWFINGVPATGHIMDPVLTLKQGESHIITMTNNTAWDHPIHLHGHSFRVISRNGQPTEYGEWQDTVLMAPREKVGIAFVADNPGDWMFHCHILEHSASGMMAVIRVGDGSLKT